MWKIGPYEKVCRKHGGNAPQVKNASIRRKEWAEAAARGITTPVETTPTRAMEDLLHTKSGEVMYLTALVNALGQDELKQRDAGGKFERPAVWVEMLWRAQDDLRRICRDMADAGFAERQGRYVDAQAMLLGAGLAWLREQLGLADDPHAEALEREMLAALAAGVAPGQRSAAQGGEHGAGSGAMGLAVR